MMKYRIAVLGLGGVGGVIGGRLASCFAGSETTEIIFISRGDHGKAIAEHGLKVITPIGETIARPALLVTEPSQLGTIDLLLVCVKTYDLESLTDFNASIHPNTVVLPLVNGTEASERICKLLPAADVWGGCIYIFARITSPGVVDDMSKEHTLHFGPLGEPRQSGKQIGDIFQMAGVRALPSSNIMYQVWEKFLFVSPLATLTSVASLNVGKILADSSRTEELLSLVSEVAQVAKSNKAGLPVDVIETTMQKYTTLPPAATSSMYNDYMCGKRTEVDALTAFVVREGASLNIPTPTYSRMLESLTEGSLYPRHKL